MDTKWWQNEVVYQIYPRSFADSNDDGIGDIPGIISKLDYLKDLGVTMLWICPMYKSPMDDNGYDISDYEDLNPEYGTLADLDALIAQAKQRGIKVIMDLVINHCSDEHPWFQKALADPTSKYRDYFIFKKGHDGRPPTNWRSVFGTSVWQKVENEEDMYFFHSFSARQPDLNWENKEMRQEIYAMINRWLDRGIAGFRVDAINFIKKDQRWQDGPVDGADGLSSCFPYVRNVEGIGEMLADLRRNAFDTHDCMTVSEAVDVAYDKVQDFIGDTGCFSMMFDFMYTNIDVENEDIFKRTSWTVPEFKEILYTSQLELQKTGWSAPFIENHDQPRAISKLVRDPAYQNFTGASAIAALYFFLRGTPFIYQGQELGMANFERKSIDQFDDINAHAQYARALEEGFDQEQALHFLNLRSRDNSRTPFHWDASKPHAGFSSHTPWIEMNHENLHLDAISQQKDPDSLFHFYKKMIDIRQNSSLHEDLVTGRFAPVETEDENVIAYKRGENALIVANMSSLPAKAMPVTGRVVLNNTASLKEEDGLLSLDPWQTVVFNTAL